MKHALGQARQVTIFTEDSGSGTPVPGEAQVVNYDSTGDPDPFQTPTHQPFTCTFRRAKEFDPEIKKWILGPLPDGVVNVPGYEQDVDAPIPFTFS